MRARILIVSSWKYFFAKRPILEGLNFTGIKVKSLVMHAVVHTILTTKVECFGQYIKQVD